MGRKNCPVDGTFCYELVCSSNDMTATKTAVELGIMKEFHCDKLSQKETKKRTD